MAMKLLDLYKSLLKVAKRVVHEDGTISQTFGGKTEPSLIKGKREVLPTREHLSNPDWENRVVFHPLSENILRGESAVLEDYRQALNVRINWTFGLLGYQLLMIAASEDEHKKLSPDQTVYLSQMKNANEGTLKTFLNLMKAMPMDQNQKTFVSIYLKRGGTIAGKRYARVGVVSFPLYNELTKMAGLELWGVKFKNKKDIETIKKLLEYMIPGIETPESHNRGSDSGVAPYLDALMKAVMSVASPLNDLIEIFHNVLAVNSPEDDSHPDQLRFEDAWVETFDNLDVMVPEIRAIPMQAGNEGSPAKPVTPAPAAAASPLPAALTNPQPQQPAQPVQGGWGGQPAQPGSAFAAAAANPGPVHTGRGLDFDSLLKSNAALAQQVGGVGPNPGWGNTGGQQPQNQPSWARPQQGGWGSSGGGAQTNSGPSWAQPNQGGGGNWGGNNSGGNWGGSGYTPSI